MPFKDYFDKNQFKEEELDALTNLMIKYDLGTSTIHNYPIKQIDSDYFNIGE